MCSGNRGLFYSDYCVNTQLLNGSSNSMPQRTVGVVSCSSSSQRTLARAVNFVATEMKTSSQVETHSRGNSMQNPRGLTSMVSTLMTNSFSCLSLPRMVIGILSPKRIDCLKSSEGSSVEEFTSIHLQELSTTSPSSFGGSARCELLAGPDAVVLRKTTIA